MKWGLALAVSLALHASAALLFPHSEEEVQIAGGAPLEVALLGSTFEDAQAAGEVSDMAVPVEAPEPAVPVESASTSVAVAEAAPAVAAAEPSPSAPIAPVQPDVSPEAVIAALPERAAEAEEAEAVEAAEVIEGEEMSEVAEALAALKEVPTPSPRPDYTPAPPRAEPARPRAERAARQTGSRGSQEADNRRGVADGSATGRAAAGSNGAAQPSQAGNAAVSNYPGRVAAQLRRALRYPPEARRARLRGEVHVAFTVSGNGSVGSVQVVRSSGHPVLDRAAVEAVQRATPFPPIPPEAGRQSWAFTVPLAFTR